MYGTLKPGMRGKDVIKLLELLAVGDHEMSVKYNGLKIALKAYPGKNAADKVEYTEDIENKVKEFQNKENQKADGVVSFRTWAKLLYNYRKNKNNRGNIDRDDFKLFGKLLKVEPESLKAIFQVETGGKSGFLDNKKPKILFEAHYMYRLLKREYNENTADNYLISNPNIVARDWEEGKKLYKGGEKEWNRLNEARDINSDIANQSASWGAMQVMGENYSKCGCSSVSEFVKLMEDSEFDQFFLAVMFLNSYNIQKYLITTPNNPMPDFAGFARKYNGPGYKNNDYDTKMKDAYLNFKKNGL